MELHYYVVPNTVKPLYACRCRSKCTSFDLAPDD